MKIKRKLHISDILIILFSTTLAIAGTRSWWAGFYHSFGPGGSAYTLNFVDFMYRIRRVLYAFSYFAAAWSFTCLFLGLRQPRPALKLMIRQPGMAACLAAVTVLIIQLFNASISVYLHIIWVPDTEISKMAEISDWLDRLEEIQLVPSSVGYAVLTAWFVQIMSGRWRPESNWIAYSGRALGCFWIATIPFSWFSWNV